MGYAMAGLLSGLGQGINEAGKTLEQRREEAMKWAAELQLTQEKADAEAKLDQSKEDRADQRLTYTEQGANARTAATIAGESARQASQQTFTQKLEGIKYQREQNLVTLRGEVERQGIQFSKNLETQLNRGDVVGQDWGPVDRKTGQAELILYTKGGKTIHTGEQVMAPESRNNMGRLAPAPGVQPTGGNPFVSAIGAAGGSPAPIAAPQPATDPNAWQSKVPLARQLLGPNASPQQINQKAQELYSKYGG
jgi:hypothetical protein